MTVERTLADDEVRYEMRDGSALRCVLAFETGEEGRAVWKVLVPGPGGTEDRIGAHDFLRPDAAQLTAWLTPIVGQDAATELAEAVDADPPAVAAWQHTAGG
jgi:hypothetical protein